ncbi:uncharacterized protein LOC117319190 [Pecten maximus]|uniref:uncharacterized protein LOC117319190 n=1 Tax=Pecten maximus TaxID=6579 RepID=UPI00145815D4|nr:uncharacterized protein LOC117319190 [Pecten maximus]
MNDGSMMEAFFLERGQMDVYEKMKYEKIDEESIKDMTEEDLKEFLPKYGDRIALRSLIAKRRKHKGNAKMSLLEKLKHKLKRNQTEEEAGPSLSTLSEGSTSSYSKNALKNQRIIEFGLMVFDVSSHLYKSIRAKKGGGVRKTKVSKHNCKADLLQAAKEIFLNGQFGYGNPDEFECDIMDYKQVSLEENITVGEIIDSTKLQKLRFYLALKRKTDIASDSDDSLPDISRYPKRTRDGYVVEKDQVVKQDYSPIRQLPVSQLDVNEQTFCTSTPDNTHRSNLSQTSSDQLNLVDVFPLFYQDPEISFGPTDRLNSADETLNLQHDIDLLLEEDSAEHVSTLQNQENVTPPLRPEAAIEERTIHIRRGNCMTDLMGAFSEDKALQQVITIGRTLETGGKRIRIR